MCMPSFLIRACLVLSLATACAKGDEAASQESSAGGESTESALVAVDPEQRMDLQSMDRVLRTMGPKVERDGGVWALEYLETPVLIITDSRANRMRVVSPVIEAAKVTEAQWAAMRVANFHTALDARYAVSNGMVYSLFLHPLGSLTDAELRSAVSQVVVLSKTFGTTYNSAGISFGGGAAPDSEPSTTPTPSL